MTTRTQAGSIQGPCGHGGRGFAAEGASAGLLRMSRARGGRGAHAEKHGARKQRAHSSSS